MRNEPLQLMSIIDEGALRRLVGGREVMRAQLFHLLDMAELDTVTIQVLPTSVGAHVGVWGSFSVLDFPDPDEPAVGYFEHIAGPTFLTRAADVERCRLRLERLSSLTLNVEDSEALIRQIAEEL